MNNASYTFPGFSSKVTITKVKGTYPMRLHEFCTLDYSLIARHIMGTEDWKLSVSDYDDNLCALASFASEHEMQERMDELMALVQVAYSKKYAKHYDVPDFLVLDNRVVMRFLGQTYADVKDFPDNNTARDQWAEAFYIDAKQGV